LNFLRDDKRRQKDTMAKKQGKSSKWPGEEKWTSSVMQHGHAQIPNLLFDYAAELKITPPQQAVLFHLLKYWWVKDNPPVVSKETLARALGITPRQVQRHLKVLREKGLIETSFPRRAGLNAHQYKFDGLVKKLGKFAQKHRSKKKWSKFEQGKTL
tara:strand:+ start:439 stop:906 length:468 start_codon:yes stop_codon:yes gene_type:complete